MWFDLFVFVLVWIVVVLGIGMLVDLLCWWFDVCVVEVCVVVVYVCIGVVEVDLKLYL